MLRFWINAEGNPILQVAGYLHVILTFLKNYKYLKISFLFSFFGIDFACFLIDEIIKYIVWFKIILNCD